MNETGAILNSTRDIVHLVDGEPSHVDFPTELILQYHKMSPGYMWAFAHTHPLGMVELSSTDEGMLYGWTRTLYPYPARLITVAKIGENQYQTSVYLGLIENIDVWRANGRKPRRGFQIIRESINLSGQIIPQWVDYAGYYEAPKPWEVVLIDRSNM